MKRRIAVAITTTLVAALVVPGIAAAGQPKVPVCHRNDAGGFTRIEVAEPAYDSHIAHGDGGLHDSVPGQPGYVFDATCAPEPILLRMTTLDANGTPHLLVQWEDANADGDPSVGDVIRTGDFPVFTAAGTLDYVPAQQPEHIVTETPNASRLYVPGVLYPFTIGARDGYDAFLLQNMGTREWYAEYVAGSPDSTSYVRDSIDSTWTRDESLVCQGSPSHPFGTCTGTSGSWMLDLIQIELYWN